jgi:flavin-dependent dehydrogenase
MSLSNLYDVVIMGGGWAGNTQARHLLLNVPGIRVAIVEPRTDEQVLEDRKLGESTVEIAAVHLCKELGLHDYLIENHPPKYGLNFHWPRDPSRSGTLDDYYTVWTNRNPTIAAFQIHRGTFERDLLRMNAAAGAQVLRERVADLELRTGGEPHRVVLQDAEGSRREILARHLVDAAGRKFLIGKRIDNVVRGPEHHFGLNNGASWVRVKGVDRSRFHSGYDPLGAVASHYYGTNHFLGHGHWIWMIPIDMDTDEISIGVMHHHDVMPASSINTQEKLYAFLRANHRILYDLLQTGELVDFHYFGRPGHSSRRLFSPDNWYVIGDAAFIFDAFYSLGTSGIAFQVESVTEIVKAKLSADPAAEEKRAAFDEFNRFFMKNMVHTYRDHRRQLGHASIMSWRIFYEYMLWYGTLVPLYIGKWHLNPTFIRRLVRWNPIPFTAGVYGDLNRLVDRGANIGFMDCHRADQLGRGYTTWRAFDDYLENSKYGPQQVNIYRSAAKTYRRILVYYARLRLRGFGWAAASPRALARASALFGLSLGMSALGRLHALRHRAVPKNRQLETMRQDFRGYRYASTLVPWSAATGTAETAPVRGAVYSSLAAYATAATSSAAAAAASLPSASRTKLEEG